MSCCLLGPNPPTTCNKKKKRRPRKWNDTSIYVSENGLFQAKTLQSGSFSFFFFKSPPVERKMADRKLAGHCPPSPERPNTATSTVPQGTHAQTYDLEAALLKLHLLRSDLFWANTGLHPQLWLLGISQGATSILPTSLQEAWDKLDRGTKLPRGISR